MKLPTYWAARAGTVKLGDLEVTRLGLGTNRITDDTQSQELLKVAVKQGVNFIDTAHVYSSGESETSIGKALSPYEEGLVIATKGGVGGGTEKTGPKGSKKFLQANLDESLRKLKLDSIDLYQLHRVDPETPLTETVRALKDFQKLGKIKNIGLSEVTVEQLKAATKIVPIATVQNRYSVADRQYEAVVDYCTENQIVFIPWAPLGGFYDDRPQAVERLLKDLAVEYDVSVQMLALAWLLKRSPLMLPIPGTLSVEHLEDNLSAAAIDLTDKDYQQLLAAGR